MYYAIDRFSKDFASWLCAALVLAAAVSMTGCNSEDSANSPGSSTEANSQDPSSSEEHGDHDHADHDHADHDHADHDHADHDHADHDHDHGDHDDHEVAAKTPIEALGLVESAFAEIRGAFEKNSPEDAHGELHEVGHMLESLESMIEENTEWPDEARAALNGSVAALFEHFGTLDGTLHGDEDVDTDAAIESIAKTITELKEQLK